MELCGVAEDIFNRWIYSKMLTIALFPIGNFMYFIGYSKWLLLSSRLVAGDDSVCLFIRFFVYEASLSRLDL